MNKLMALLIAFTTIAIVVCLFMTASILTTLGAPALLALAQDHPIFLKGGTFLMIVMSTALIMIKKRSHQ